MTDAVDDIRPRRARRTGRARGRYFSLQFTTPASGWSAYRTLTALDFGTDVG